MPKRERRPDCGVIDMATIELQFQAYSDNAVPGIWDVLQNGNAKDIIAMDPDKYFAICEAVIARAWNLS